MRIIVVVPSPEYENYAGARIRYRRIAHSLGPLGVDLELRDIASFTPSTPDCDILIYSKCHDARSILGAAVAARNGARIGVDLFDDYFSTVADSRLSRFRNWLLQMLPNCHFALCSTKVMAQVVARFEPNLPTHVMNDPAVELRLEQLPQTLSRKLAEVRNGRRLVVAWFGVGDNPYFPVGLRDLSAFGSHLVDFAAAGLDVELRVVTNPRALTADGLALLDQLPVRTEIREWTEDAEQELLLEAFLAFLPVSAQPFSAAKSLNRAVTALGAGCQVLSLGYPLYSQLDGLIYRDAKSLLLDIEKEALRFSEERLDDYRDAMGALASPEREARGLLEFIRTLRVPTSGDYQLALIHGQNTNGLAHKMVQTVNGLSVASPYCAAELGFDVVFQGSFDRLVMLVSEKASRRLRPEFASKLTAAPNIFGRKFLEISDQLLPVRRDIRETERQAAAPTFELATYAACMDQVGARIMDAFGPCQIMISETSPLPFSSAN